MQSEKFMFGYQIKQNNKDTQSSSSKHNYPYKQSDMYVHVYLFATQRSLYNIMDTNIVKLVFVYTCV